MNKKSLTDFYKKNSTALAVPLIMIIIGLLLTISPGDAVDFTVRTIGIIFVAIGIFIGSSLVTGYSRLILAVAIIFAVIGIVCIANPGLVAAFIIKTIGLIVIVNSAIRVYEAYQIKGKTDNFMKYIVNDILTLLLGLCLLIFPITAATVVVKIVGVVMIILGITNVITAFKVYKDGRYVDDGSDVVWEE